MIDIEDEDSIIEYLRSGLEAAHHELLEVALSASFLRRDATDARGGKEIRTFLSLPTDSQTRARHAMERFDDMVRISTSFIKRGPPETARKFDEFARLLATYFQLNRVGGNIDEATWKEFFRAESSALLQALVSLVERSRAAFSILRRRKSFLLEDFVIQARMEADGDVLISAKAFGSAVEARLVDGTEDLDVEHFLLRHCIPRSTVRAWVPTSLLPAQRFGARLFRMLFAGPVGELYWRARARAAAEDRGLRVRLELDLVPKWAPVPWELIFDGQDFLALNSRVSVARYTSTAALTNVSTVDGPLRLLVTMSSPGDVPGLSSTMEKDRLEDALEPLIAIGRLRVDICPDGTLSTLRRTLSQAEALGTPYHAWHFIGHGIYEDEHEAGFLAFEGPNRRHQRVSGFELATLFASHSTMQLALINSCHGARYGGTDPTAAVAQSLVRRGMPAVIAMQFEITDRTAVLLTEEFYGSLADGLTVERALSEARRAVFFQPNYVEWATPVIFLRGAPDALFETRG